MFGRNQKLTVAFVFILTSLLAFSFFIRMEEKRHRTSFQDMKTAFELVSNLTASAVASTYYRNDMLFGADADEEINGLKALRSKILSDYPYIDSIDLYEAAPSFDRQPYMIHCVNNRIHVDFPVFDLSSNRERRDRVISAKLNSRRILKDLGGYEKFSFSPCGKTYGYFFDKKVYSLLPLLRPYHIFASLLIAFFLAFWTKKSICEVSGFFYRSRGLKKLITIFEHAERYSANHSRNVAAIAEQLGSGLGLRRKSLKDLRIAALFHDIGKIAVPVSILNKKGSLSLEEFEIVKRHTADSAEIIQDFEELAHLSVFIRHHHEKMDGSGYPSGLKGEEIPLYSRIIAVADIFEALVGERPYRQPMAPHKALKLMETEMSLDPVVLAVLRQNFEVVLKVLRIKETHLFSA